MRNTAFCTWGWGWGRVEQDPNWAVGSHGLILSQVGWGRVTTAWGGARKSCRTLSTPDRTGVLAGRLQPWGP